MNFINLLNYERGVIGLKKKLRCLIACAMMMVMVLTCMPMAVVAAGGSYKVYEMGDVEVHVLAEDTGQLGRYEIFVNLNGYVPSTVSSTIKGDFTQKEINDTMRIIGADSLPGIAPMITNVGIYDAVVSNSESMLNVISGGARVYARNVYSTRDLTSITYSIIQPGDQPLRGMHIAGCGFGVRLQSSGGDSSLRKTTHYVYIDGNLIFECTINDGMFASYRVHTANFQTKPAGGSVNVVPAATKIYIDGRQVDVGTYSIGGSNYMRLRDIAYLLKDTKAKFGIETRQNGSMIDVVPGETYLAVGGELSKLSSGKAIVSRAEIACEYDEESWAHPDDFPYHRPYTNLRTGERTGPSGKSLTYYIATYQELFRPVGYNVGGNNFYKLRDIAQIAGFDVQWDSTAKSVRITTTT